MKEKTKKKYLCDYERFGFPVFEDESGSGMTVLELKEMLEFFPEDAIIRSNGYYICGVEIEEIIEANLIDKEEIYLDLTIYD